MGISILFMMFCGLVFSDKDFCTTQGGTIYQMAMWNGYPGLGKQINGLIPVCFIPDETKVNNYTIPLDTLSNTLPTLAVLAFSAKIPFIPSIILLSSGQSYMFKAIPRTILRLPTVYN
eukprot:TRINITY_DN2642_c0_g1_i4.p1 TRINITY_DN2642_c0_g1~~TRINITY_DN2642_c0_g1_i4.p1  ORF type:complete len:118 (-),score=6.29 TRINITY_DN2642_c0_g1_i4:314-667(-)